jgi:hypothetical protein
MAGRVNTADSGIQKDKNQYSAFAILIVVQTMRGIIVSSRVLPRQFGPLPERRIMLRVLLLVGRAFILSFHNLLLYP